MNSIHIYIKTSSPWWRALWHHFFGHRFSMSFRVEDSITYCTERVCVCGISETGVEEESPWFLVENKQD